jgi:hypothetical protein
VRLTARSFRLVAVIASLVVLAGACGETGGAGASTTTSHPATPAHPLSSHPVSRSVRPAACPRSWEPGTSQSDLNRGTHLPGLSQTLVPEGPTYLTICRYAGLNQKAKVGTLERSRVVTGAELATFVNYIDEPIFQVVKPGEPYFCPVSTGRTDLLQFVYPSGSLLQVQVDVDGCTFVSNGYRTLWGSLIVARVTAWIGSDKGP